MRYFRVWLFFIKTAIIRTLEFRADFVAWTCINLLWMVFQLTFYWVIYQHTNAIAGWDADQLRVLLGTCYVIEFAVWTFGYPNLGRISGYVSRGELDLFLLKPLNSQFHVSLKRMSPHNVPGIIPASLLVITGLQAMGARVDALTVVLYLALVGAGMLIFYALWFMSITTVIWLQRCTNIQELFLVALPAQKVPPEVFGLLGRFVLTFVLPVAMVTAFPTQAAMGLLSPQMAALMALTAAVLLWLSSRLWTFALRSYSSASS